MKLSDKLEETAKKQKSDSEPVIAEVILEDESASSDEKLKPETSPTQDDAANFNNLKSQVSQPFNSQNLESNLPSINDKDKAEIVDELISSEEIKPKASSSDSAAPKTYKKSITELISPENFMTIKPRAPETSVADNGVESSVLNTIKNTMPKLEPSFKYQNTKAFEEIEAMGALFQKVEIILSYLIILFKNEEDLLYPLAGHLEECTRIIEMYCSMHFVYKVYYGKNYLNKLKIVAKSVLELVFEREHFKFKTATEVIEEIRKYFPDLAVLMLQSYLNKLSLVPDSLVRVINEVLDQLLVKLDASKV